MWIAGLIMVALIMWIILKPKKENVKPDEETQEEACAELKKLVVYYNGRALLPREIIKIKNNTKVEFRVRGYDITGTKDACINGEDIFWGKSCPCTYWENVNGLANLVWTNNNTLNTPRNVNVKHKTGLIFNWKIEVV